jgi:hypothetical protein
MTQDDDRLREVWDRLVILLVSQPREGWEHIFEEITRGELDRLSVPSPGEARDANGR